MVRISLVFTTNKLIISIGSSIPKRRIVRYSYGCIQGATWRQATTEVVFKKAIQKLYIET